MKEEFVSVVEYRRCPDGDVGTRLLWGGWTDVGSLVGLGRSLGRDVGVGVRAVLARRERWGLVGWACLYEDGVPVREESGKVDGLSFLEALMGEGGIQD